MKKFNRICELKLRDAELLLAVALTLNRIPEADMDEVRAKVHEAWRLLLVNQFHDVLPGSSIEMAHVEAKQWFHDSLRIAQEVTDKCLNWLGVRPTIDQQSGYLNTLPWERDAIVRFNGLPYAVHFPPMSWNCKAVEPLHPVVVGNAFLKRQKEPPSLTFCVLTDQSGETIKITNRFFSVEFDSSGRIVSMVHLASGNQTIPAEHYGNQLTIYDDIPLYWDAWDCMDYHIETRQTVNTPGATKEELYVESATPDRVTLVWSQTIGKHSLLQQLIRVTAVNPFVEFDTQVEWAENRKFLKVEFPVDVHSTSVS